MGVINDASPFGTQLCWIHTCHLRSLGDFALEKYGVLHVLMDMELRTTVSQKK
jgi:hypothetical protein